MELIVKRLESLGHQLSSYIALEFYARMGDWQTQSYAKQVKELNAWEIDPLFEPQLRKNLPNAHIRIGDSFKIAQEEIYKEKFDFIVFDNPQNMYGEYCEHFEALPLVKKLLKTSGIVIFNINLSPFDYDKFPLWQKRRSEYYSTEARNLTPCFMLNYYENFFNQEGFDVIFCFEEKRNQQYLSYLVFSLTKVI